MLEEILAGGATALGIPLPEGALALYRRYFEALTAANRQFNLTSIEGEDMAARLHFLDSLCALACAPLAGCSLIDAGTGGGLPGLALKIAEPSMDLTLLDATEKKVAFLRTLTAELAIPCTCVCARAEELGRESAYRERYDAATARAVADLRILAELCLPLVRVGGRFLALKSSAAGEEIAGAVSSIRALGGEIADVREILIPETDIRRRVVIVEKRRPTPERFPRRWSAIQKKPAG